MIESLENRRLFAASATLTPDGVLGVVGTNESDRIAISATISFTVPKDGVAVTTINAYSVTVNGSSLGTFDGDAVKRINVFALGGNDRVSGPPTATRAESASTDYASNGSVNLTRGTPTNYKAVPVISLAGAIVAPMYVEGGSGSDGLTGGTGNDTLRGGRGRDYLFSDGGNDLLDGQSGDDTIFADDGTGGGLVGNRVAAAFRTGDVILSNAGTDTIYADERDDLRYEPGTRGVAPITDVVGVTVFPQRSIIN